jgi:transcriptional accessory protein Tex/SPT6
LVYSASAYASEELPGLDVTLRGAGSIARRLQDPSPSW